MATTAMINETPASNQNETPAVAVINDRSAGTTKTSKFQPGNPHRWTKGQSGNAAGRPKAQPISESLTRFLLTRLAEDATGKRLRKKYNLGRNATWADAVAMATIHRALVSTAAAEAIRDSIEGRPVAKVEYGGWNGGPVRISVHYERSPPKE